MLEYSHILTSSLTSITEEIWNTADVIFVAIATLPRLKKFAGGVKTSSKLDLTAVWAVYFLIFVLVTTANGKGQSFSAMDRKLQTALNIYRKEAHMDYPSKCSGCRYRPTKYFCKQASLDIRKLWLPFCSSYYPQNPEYEVNFAPTMFEIETGIKQPRR